MFTGIVEAVGKVDAIFRDNAGARISIISDLDMSPGDSVSVSGVCLTVKKESEGGFFADIMAETLKRTNLGSLKRSSRVNLERAVVLGGRLGGHIVLGHVDGVGVVTRISHDGDARIVTVRCPARLSRYVVEKGSITVDGVSLTVANSSRECFAVSLVSYTLEQTTLGDVRPGTEVNLECDVIGKYVERFLRNSIPKSALDEIVRDEGALDDPQWGWGSR